jgi:hypothetical protein
MYLFIQKSLERCLNQMMPSPADIPSVHSSQPVNDVGFLVTLMPNRGRARFLRGVAWLFLAIGILGCLSVSARVISEFRARHSWPVAQGVVVAKDVKTNKDIPGNLTRHTSYWIEYEVRFAVPAEQCRTGTIYGDEWEPLPCWGIARITQRRLQFLETLPDDYDASPPPASKPPGPNDSIELKLS